MEWNALLDPHAAAIVYRSQVAVHRSVGLDVTLQVTMPVSEVRRRFQAPILAPVLDFAEVWFKEQDRITFHDPLAAATVFDPQICTFQSGRVEIDLAPGDSLGTTSYTPGPIGPHEVAVKVNKAAFFKHYFDTIHAIA